MLERRGLQASARRGNRLNRAKNLLVRRLKRKQLALVPVASHLVRSNRESAILGMKTALQSVIRFFFRQRERSNRWPSISRSKCRSMVGSEDKLESKFYSQWEVAWAVI